MVIPFLKKNGKYTLYDTNNNYLKYKGFNVKEIDFHKLLDLDYENISFFKEGFARASAGEYSEMFINSNGEVLNNSDKYYKVHDFEDGIAAVSDGKHWTFINRVGLELTPEKKYNTYQRLENGFIKVFIINSQYYDPLRNECYPSDYLYGLIDLHGYEVIKPSLLDIYVTNRFIILFPSVLSKYNSKIDFPIEIYNLSGNKIFLQESENLMWISDFYENRAIAQLIDSKEFVILDEKLNVVKNLGYRENGDIELEFSNGYLPIKDNDKWGLIDLNGNFVLKPKYDELRYFFTQYTAAGIILNDKIKYAIIDFDFNEKTAFIFDEIKENEIQNGLIIVSVNNKFGLIDVETLKVVIYYEFDNISLVANMYQVSKGDYHHNGDYVGLCGIYDCAGQKVIPLIYEEIIDSENGYFVVKKSNKYGVIDKSGNIVIEITYDLIYDWSEDFYRVNKNDKDYIVDLNEISYLEN